MYKLMKNYIFCNLIISHKNLTQTQFAGDTKKNYM